MNVILTSLGAPADWKFSAGEFVRAYPEVLEDITTLCWFMDAQNRSFMFSRAIFMGMNSEDIRAFAQIRHEFMYELAIMVKAVDSTLFNLDTVGSSKEARLLIATSLYKKNFVFRDEKDTNDYQNIPLTEHTAYHGKLNATILTAQQFSFEFGLQALDIRKDGMSLAKAQMIYETFLEPLIEMFNIEMPDDVVFKHKKGTEMFGKTRTEPWYIKIKAAERIMKALADVCRRGYVNRELLSPENFKKGSKIRDYSNYTYKFGKKASDNNAPPKGYSLKALKKA